MLIRIYAKEKQLGSFWVGVNQTNSNWTKSNGEVLSALDVNVTNDWSLGDCMIADASNEYQHKIVDCESSFPVSIIM